MTAMTLSYGQCKVRHSWNFKKEI